METFPYLRENCYCVWSFVGAYLSEMVARCEQLTLMSLYPWLRAVIVAKQSFSSGK